jgi:hypothetical protein
MEDRLLYATLLGIEFPWLISRVHVDRPAERIDVWVEEASGARFACAACQQGAPVYDHTPEPSMAASGDLPMSNLRSCKSAANHLPHGRGHAGSISVGGTEVAVHAVV